MKYKFVIFDLDGTILDTLQDLYSSVNFALKKNCLTERSIEEVRAFVGNGIRLLIERSVPENTDISVTEQVLCDFREHYALHSKDTTKPYDGIIELLTNLRRNGIKTAVVSNKTDFAVQELIKLFFDGLFDFVAGDREGINKKPAPDTVFEAIKSVEIEAEQTVYVGDSEVDIQTAKNASIDCIAVDWGFRDRIYLEKNGASVIVSEVEALYNNL